MNIVLVIVDTLRQDHVGAYGNRGVHTPHFDAFARESVVLTRAYSESLPTLCVRRAMHTGMRTFPFRGHFQMKGDLLKSAPGWGPIPEEQTTVAELLSERGYVCGLVSDTYHMFKPSKNFHRGFHEWNWIRGQESDRYRSGPEIPDALVERHMSGPADSYPALATFLRKYLRNQADRLHEEDYQPARVFREAARWIEDNHRAERFFLVVDSFDPHEPWNPPANYRRLYDTDEGAPDLIQSIYGRYEGRLTDREVRRFQSNYAGEVTLVDRWFGHFMETLRLSGRLEDTVVAVMSDHGHNIGFPMDKGLISKQGHPMTRSVADLVMMIRHPDGVGAGTRCDALAYNHDLVETLLTLSGNAGDGGREGIDFWPVVRGEKPRIRDHVTVAWGPLMTVITDEWWYNATIWGEAPLLHRVREDPQLLNDCAADQPAVCASLLDMSVRDAGGKVPAYFSEFHDTPGCTPFEDKTERVEQAWLKLAIGVRT